MKKYNSIGKEEILAANKVLKSGVLSEFIAKPGDYFLGGRNVKKFEKMVCKIFKVKYAISVNSWTSGLTAAIGAIGIEPGDEIICSPWTMSASAISILHWNAIPVFVDIDPVTFNLDLKKLKSKISKKTRAIMAVDIFGQSEAIDEIKEIIKNKNIKIISDAAQSPYAFYKKKFAGTLGDIGGYSLNYHKHINTGEGGIIVTNNKILASRARLIRNHAESSISKFSSINDLSNMIGYNFRLGEIEAAIGIEQLKKLKKIVLYRQKLAKILTSGLSDLQGLKVPYVRPNCSHVYYVYPLVLEKTLKIKRDKIIKLLVKEGVVGLMKGYINLYELPIFKKKIAYGKKGFPWRLFKSKVNYSKKNYPNTEELHNKRFFGILLCSYDYKEKDVNLIVQKFKRVWSKLGLNVQK